ncbi:hypothetical protein [Citromicrobium sp. WPS32]|uniref:hypothetical protein n=1 Tax=Citromicrobium sp. WPS32 TaxID=1634517 RepID=UPI0006C92CA7|nr:hypothetical protein [Citromicrobium sp. WPS32]KPM17975.1 hypothetical protein WG75_01620 [Citromicrobium sp. WPS32]|tara:strand:+ start:391 stop:900 length:510 start_codon:yes stop_codon:yes gene_type:complete
MWDSPDTLAALGNASIYVALAAALVAAFAGAAETIASNRANDIVTRDSQEQISAADARAAEANARAEEARARAEEANAEAAKANERVQKSQETRRLSAEQVEVLGALFRSDVFQRKKDDAPLSKTLRVSSVEDSEARMHAMEWQNLLQSCGVNTYPTGEGGASINLRAT